MTVRPPDADTVRPGDGDLTLEEYLGIVGLTRLPPPLSEEEMSLDELVGEILGRHERELALLEELDEGWDEP